jgi:CobQ-like glutamine amidotransferase family enzyme
MSVPGRAQRVVIAHLFPDLLNLYGDRGNVEALVRRAQWRGIAAEVRGVSGRDGALLDDADVIFVGGGADRDQAAVAATIAPLAEPLAAAIARGAALLAVCAGYQNLGHAYRSPLIGEIRGPGILDVETNAPVDAVRLVGGVVIELTAGSPAIEAGAASAAAAGVPDGSRFLVGFENHSGRTTLGPSMRPLGRVVVGSGNDAASRDEGAIAMPGDGGIAGLRIGTYLHGPLLPRNPHLADVLLAAGMSRGGTRPAPDLAPLPDTREWLAHAAFEADWRERKPGTTRRSGLGRAIGRIQSLVGF